MRPERETGFTGGVRMTEHVATTLRRIMRAIDVRSKLLAARYGLTGPQVAVLKELSAREGISVSGLTGALHLSQATVTGILDRLETRGLVRRERSSQDKRCVLVWMTDAGRKVASGAPPLLQEEFTAAFEELKDWEQTQILSSLQRLAAMMEAGRIEATPILATGPLETGQERGQAFRESARGGALETPETEPAGPSERPEADS